MNDQNYTRTFTVDQSAADVFDAINDVRGWCYDVCSDAWGGYITGSLRDLITTGEGQPNPSEEIVASA